MKPRPSLFSSVFEAFFRGTSQITNSRPHTYTTVHTAVKRASCRANRRIEWTTLLAGGYLFTLPGEGGLLSCAAVSTDGSRVVTGSVGGAVNVWEGGGSGSSIGGGGGGGDWAGDAGSWGVDGSKALGLGCETFEDDSDSDIDSEDEEEGGESEEEGEEEEEEE